MLWSWSVIVDAATRIRARMCTACWAMRSDHRGLQPGGPQQGFEYQPLRDWLDAERRAGRWNGEPPPHLPDDVIAATSERYLNASQGWSGCGGVRMTVGAAAALPRSARRAFGSRR